MVVFNRFLIKISKGNFRCIHRYVGFTTGLFRVKTIQLKKSSAIKNNEMSTNSSIGTRFQVTVDADCETGHEHCVTVSVQLLALILVRFII